MGSPFPLHSSGQSLPDERHGYSPRDFGMVPRTPQIPDQRTSSLDQSVPHTPDTAVVPGNSRTRIVVAESITPCNSRETPMASTVMYRDEDSMWVHPDQRVPATPLGGFLAPAYHSPVPYFTHFNSPPSLQISEEATVPRATQSSTSTPSQSSHTAESRSISQKRLKSNHTPPENTRRQTSHTRQTPSLSSRRRLSLDLCLEITSHRVQNRKLIHQITLGSADERQDSSFTADHNIIINRQQNDHGPSFSQRPGSMNTIVGDEERGIDDNLPPIQLNEGSFRTHNSSSVSSSVFNTETIIQANNGTVNNLTTTIPQLQPSASCSWHTNPLSGVPLISSDDGSCDAPCSTKNSRLENENNENKKSEIDRRVQRVLACVSASNSSTISTMSTTKDCPDSQNSAFTLFEDDDSFFG